MVQLSLILWLKVLPVHDRPDDCTTVLTLINATYFQNYLTRGGGGGGGSKLQKMEKLKKYPPDVVSVVILSGKT